jgi:hypothetical protein
MPRDVINVAEREECGLPSRMAGELYIQRPGLASHVGNTTRKSGKHQSGIQATFIDCGWRTDFYVSDLHHNTSQEEAARISKP